MELRGDANRIVVDGEAANTWADLGGGAALPDPVAVLTDDPRAAFAAVRGHAAGGGELLLVAASRADDEMRAELRAAGFHLADGHTVQSPTQPRPAEPDRVWILTSGSTGRPKRVGHTLASLATVGTEQPARTWLCPYSPGTYAWWQLAMLSLTQPGQHLVAVSADRLVDWPEIAVKDGVTAVSGTPTFWRQTLFRSGAELAALPLEQVTLGGEPVDQAILDRLRETFPRARVSWIYASSEVGAAIVVHDGRAGFPRRWLNRAAPGRPLLSVEGGELVVRSPYAGTSLDGPVHTGDRVELTADRVLIIGRRGSDEINVGGSKISAGVVRDTLQEHPSVAWARVRARRAPIVGHVVVADVVTDGTVDVATLTQWAAGRLPEYGVPRRFTVLEEIPVKETLKSDV
ncbi:MAG: AMP-binding protein [Streptosporangiales bacterium]|nr:AMP-binding protein [Streptosporangiales bacterium]